MNDLLLSSYDYNLPEELIANHPTYPKENGRLLVYDRKTRNIVHTTFAYFCDFIPKDSTIVFNDTKVIKARIYGNKVNDGDKIGGKIEALFHKVIDSKKFLFQFRGRLRVDSVVYFDGGIFAKILKDNGGGFKEAVLSKDIKFLDLLDDKELLAFLDCNGVMPLPPYIKQDDNCNNSNSEYNSVFAKNLGAVAAPTASLHFSEEAFLDIQNNYKSIFVTLHVGAGTYLSVESENILEHNMHKERFFISDDSASKIDDASHITTIGTTATRVVETYCRSGIRSGECDLFLNPKNKPIRTDSILTNFHLPKTTLLMLVASFIGLDELKRIYSEAIKERYRFYSYGDGMLIL